MWNSKSKEVPLQNPRHSQNRDSTRDQTAVWDTFSQTKAALRHIENKLEVVPTSTAVFDSVMDAKKSSANATRKISRKAFRSFSQNKSRKEKTSRSPLRATTLESNVKKSSRVEFREPLASYRETYGSPSYHSSSQLEAKHLQSSLEGSEAEGKIEGTNHVMYNRDERDPHSRDFESPHSSAADETVVRYLNDRPAIDALQSNEILFKAVTPTRSEEENNGSRGDESGTKTLSTTAQDPELKGVRLSESSPSSTSTSSAHRLEILKRRQHDNKLEKLKERIRKQWEHSEELSSRGQLQGYAEQPVVVTNVESAVTPKVRKVAVAPPAPAYKGFNPAETKIRTPGGKVWHEDEFHSISRELYQDIALQLTEDSTMKETATEKGKEKKSTRPMRKVQKLRRSSSPDSKSGGSHVINASSWRDGQKLVKKILGPAPKLEQQDRRATSSDRTGRERATKSSGCIGRTSSDPRLDVTNKTYSRSSERSRSKVRSENNLKKLENTLPESKQDDHSSLNKDFLPVEIRGILDDLQLESMTQSTKQEKDGEKQSQKFVLLTQGARSHSPTKRKPDKLASCEEPQVISKKRHYDTDEVRQYIIRQQEERKRRQNEEKKAQKEATEQKNKRLQELYRKQREAFAKAKNMPPPEPSAARRLQETYSKLLLEQTLLEEPSKLAAVQEMQARPVYQPSGESDKENKAQERPPSASSSSDMSLSEPSQPLVRNDLMEPTWIQPDRLSPRVQFSQPQPFAGSSGGLFSQLLSLEQMGLLQKDFDTAPSPRRNHNAAMGSLTLTSQPYLNSSSAQQDLLAKPATGQYRSKLERIEALKATAASLSSRIESETKKLAGAGINYGSVWNTEHELLHQGNLDDGRWAKVVSPPVREDNEDVFSARIQKMLGTCVSHTSFDDNLPGVGNLSEFKKLPETIRPHTAAVSLGMRSPASQRPEGILGHLSKRSTDSPGCEKQPYGQNKVIIPRDSSIDSISEGPLLSEGSLSEEDGSQSRQSPLKTAEVFKEKEFCVREKNAFEPIKEFQKEAEKYMPLFTQTSSTQSKGPWEELAKGSPHSVINIFAKSYQLHGKGLEERSNGGSPILRPLLPAMSPPDSVVSYEDDFVSSQGSGTLTDKKNGLEPSISGSSIASIREELRSRRSPHEPRSVELGSPHSSGHRSAASSRSSTSSKRIGRKEKLESFNGSSRQFPMEEDKMLSESDHGSQQAKKSLPSSRISNRDHEQSPDTDSTLEELSGHSVSFSDKGKSLKTPTSPPSPGSQKLLQFDSVGNTERARSPGGFSLGTTSGFKSNVPFPDLSMGINRTTVGAPSVTGSMHLSPAGLQHRLSAELNYLNVIEESVRQLSDVERVRGISLAQQESVSLAQILKAQQQRHERDLALLKLKAEQEALESQRQLDEARQKAAQVHAESLQHLVQSRQEAVEALQETTCKIAAKQVEAALLTTDAARQIREMTELARTQIPETVSAPAAPITALYDDQRQHHSEFIKQIRACSDPNRKSESGVPSQTKEDTTDSKQMYSPSFDSYSESSRSKNHDRSSSSSLQESPSVPSSKENEKKEKKPSRREKMTSSIEDHAPTVVDDSLRSDSIPSLPDEKGLDSASIATEYSLKFDESMTEDEIEEKSFRSLLPSESHRRINMEKKRGHRDDSDEEVSPEKTALSSIKELSMPFSGGQDSFSKFTMEMVRQYMKEEEMRAAHQSSLLRLREKALKEKTKAELAWLEHQKKHLRDKGEDDKMPPIRKRQRGLLLKLQQEQAEIKRLQEANKAARKERQLILKQQEEIERICQTTVKLQEKLKSAGENKLELHSEDDIKQSNASSPLPTDTETRSPSPISISSSETSSIMQKLKKMRSRMDEKFLTKREQKLMQRRQHAEELLEWKRRLDAEEVEIRRIEKQALAAWDKQLLKTKTAKKDLGDQRTEPKETASEEESPVLSCSHLNSESSVPEELGSPPAESIPSEIIGHEQPGSPDHSTLTEEIVSSQGLKSTTSPAKLSPSKSSTSLSKQDSSKGSHRTGGQLRLPLKSHQVSHSWSDESLSMTQSETTSDQSDIEGRIRALKEELRKRKSVVYQLKKQQKKRQKERLKAQEASLIKQLESYDEFIKQTEAELSQDLDTSPTAKPQIKTPSSATEKPKIKPPPLHRPEATKNWKSSTESERSKVSLESIAEHVDAVPSNTERSVSMHSKRFIETEIHTEEPSQTLSKLPEEMEYVKPGEFEVEDPCTEIEQSQKELFGFAFENIQSREEISEQKQINKDEVVSDRSSIHSERLLELKSPTELIKDKERSDVTREPGPIDSSPWASVSIVEEADGLLNFHIGDRVLVSSVQPGTLKFKGLTRFAKGIWAGVELDKPEGNNNGTYDESFDTYVDTNEDLFFDDKLNQHHKTEPKNKGSSKPGKYEEQERDATEKYSQDKAPTGISAQEGPAGERDNEDSSPEAKHVKEISAAVESLAQEQSVIDCLKYSIKDDIVPGTIEKISAVLLEDTSDNLLSEKLEKQRILGEECIEKLDHLSSRVLEKLATPLMDLLTKEKSQLEAQLKLPLREEEKSEDQLEKVSLLTDVLLKDFLKDAVKQFQQIKRVRNEKIQLSNRELCDGQEELSPRTPTQHVEEQGESSLQDFFLNSKLEDEREEVSSPDMCPRPESPVFGASGQKELAKRLAELELSREFLSALGDDQDWFDEDFGLSSHKVQQKQAEEPAVLPKTEPQKVPAKPCEEPLAVPHTAVEVEGMVHEAAEELWKLKELGHDLQSISLPVDLGNTIQEQDMETISKQVYKKAVFDLTREIFGEIFAEDPNLNQPIWMKPYRITSSYFRRVKDPNDLDEIKNFIAAEVLKLFCLRKEPNHKTDWQKMMKFGRKKRDRVDHILVQELHEEEAQWVNYDEDELCVKMQLADGIFEALIRDTIDVLNQINEKQQRLLLV
ncbi:centrosome-associated protein 350 isoform D [Alligator mississippiensis]|uniref:Centrosome-associated protein 350 isoform D n=1 Tax=Alligator mississippiensis TaxID=8496 RepID=A0A151MIE0_ALLMI|nr:centrosome-associated protein 350 isoform D [Alligator mississippiensis]